MRACLAIALVALVMRGVALGQTTDQSSTGGSSSSSSLNSAPSLPPERPGLIYYPPTPPPLDLPQVRLELVGTDPNSAPPALSAYVDELFYASLGPRLEGDTGSASANPRGNRNPSPDLSPLNRRQQTRLADYDRARAAAYQELRIEIERTRPLDPEPRRLALADFARRQTPQLIELEAEAERLRRDFMVRDWREFRHWKLGESSTRRSDSPREIAEVMRAYAYFQKDLSISQRRLLREIFNEFALAMPTTTGAAKPLFWYFSPEPARIILPFVIPPALAEKFGVYQTRKSELKKELYDAIYAAERSFGIFRNVDFRELAASQAPKFVAVEALAEEIRVDLSRLPGRGRATETSPLPDSLTARFFDSTKERSAIKRDTYAAIRALESSLADHPIRIGYSFTPDTLTYTVSRPRSIRTSNPAEARLLVESTEQQLEVIAAAFKQRMTEQAKGYEALMAEAKALMPDASTGQIYSMVQVPMRMALREDHRDAFYEYYLATLEPGFSIEQRRLLFGSAVKHLDLNLPLGEMQPTERQLMW